MPSMKRKILAVAKKLGATVSYNGGKDYGHVEITVNAPAGFVFAANGCHGVVACGSDGEPWDVVERMTLDDLKHGLEPCDNPDCDTCH